MRENIDIVITDTQPAVEGETIASGRQKTAAVFDRKGGRAWTAEGPDASTASTEAVRKFLGDRRAREYVGP